MDIFGTQDKQKKEKLSPFERFKRENNYRYGFGTHLCSNCKNRQKWKIREFWHWKCGFVSHPVKAPDINPKFVCDQFKGEK